jgi:serine/threonine protein kinase
LWNSHLTQTHLLSLCHVEPTGCVKLARHRRTNEQVAIKIISKASLANRAAVNRGIEREIAIMKLINHPHVIRLYDVYETEKEL